MFLVGFLQSAPVV